MAALALLARRDQKNQTIPLRSASYLKVTRGEPPSLFNGLAQLLGGSRPRRLACLLAVALCSPAWATAQAAQATTHPPSPAANEMPATTKGQKMLFSSYEGQTVSSVEVAGRPDTVPSQFEAIMAQKEGQPFSAAKVEQTATALEQTGKFKQVRIEVEPEANGVRVTYILEPAIWFGIYRFPGAERFAYSELLQVTSYPVQRPFDSTIVREDGNKLESFLQQEGFFQAQVETKVKVDPARALANVDYEVTLDRRAKFGTVRMAGGTSAQEAKLEHKLTTPWARLRGTAIRPGKTFHRSTLDKATHYLTATLAKQGYLGARVQLLGAQYHPGVNRADIQFQLKPGVKTQVKITGAHIWSWDRKKLLPIYQGIGVDQEAVQEGRQELISFFQAKGYFDVKVDAQLHATPQGDTVLYNITKEKKHELTSIRIAGNQQIPDSTLSPSIALQKKHLFSPGKFSNVLVRTSVKNLTGIYRAEGFSEVKVAPDVTAHGDDIRVTFKVVEGPRNVVNAVAIEGDKTFPESQFAPHGLKVRVGEPYSQAHVEEDRTAILANYLRAGYLNAGFRETASQASPQQPHRINVIYHIYEGPRVMAGNIYTLGREHTVQRLINRGIGDIKPQKPLTEAELLSASTKLYDNTGVFDWAQVDPKRQISTQSAEDVLVKVHEAKRNEFQYGFGFEVLNRGGSIPSGTVALPNLPPIGLPKNFTTSQTTFYGPRGTAQYTRNNVRGKGESFSITAFAGRLDQRGALYYIDPNFRWSSWKATSEGSIERNEENPIFSSQIAKGSLQFQRPIDHAQKDIVFFRYSYSKTDITRVLIPALVPAEDQHIKLSTLAANITRDTRDNALDEHHGSLDSLELDFNSSKLGSTVDFAKLTGQAAFFREAFHHIVWANSIRIGLAQPFNNSFVPLSEAFFTGGGNTLRGFPLDGAGPQRQVQVCSSGAGSACSFIQVPAGGNEMLILNAEARIPLSWLMKPLGFVLFYDGGDVFPNVGFHDFTSLYSNNLGLGLRYETPVGPIRLDIGRNLNPVPGISPTQYFVGIGQAF